MTTSNDSTAQAPGAAVSSPCPMPGELNVETRLRPDLDWSASREGFVNSFVPKT